MIKITAKEARQNANGFSIEKTEESILDVIDKASRIGIKRITLPFHLSDELNASLTKMGFVTSTSFCSLWGHDISWD